MPSLKAIRTRIASVKSTQKITRAMKLVAAARLRRAQDAIVAARPYANALADAVAELALRVDISDFIGLPPDEAGEAPALLEQRAPSRLTLVPITTDRGLAGGLNANIFRAVQRFVTEKPDAREISLEVVGRKGRDYFRRRKLPVNHELPGATGENAVELSRQAADIVAQSFRDGRTDAVFLVYNEFRSAMAQRVVVEPLLPISTAALAPRSGGAATTGAIDFLYEPTKQQLLDTLLPQYVASQIYRAMLEAVASEFGARMT